MEIENVLKAGFKKFLKLDLKIEWNDFDGLRLFPNSGPQCRCCELYRTIDPLARQDSDEEEMANGGPGGSIPVQKNKASGLEKNTGLSQWSRYSKLHLQ